MPITSLRSITRFRSIRNVTFLAVGRIWPVNFTSPEPSARPRPSLPFQPKKKPTGGLEQLEAILEDVRVCGAIEYTEDEAQRQSELAIAAISILPESDYKAALIALANAAVNRRN